MTSKNDNLLRTISDWSKRYGDNDEQLLRALKALAKTKVDEPEVVVRLHEALLFLRAYPPGARALKETVVALNSLALQVARLRDMGIDLSLLDEPEVSGIAGTAVTSDFSYAIVRWLVAKHPTQVSIDWDWFENEDTFGATMPRFLPLLDEDAMVEAHVPYREWLQTARGRQSELVWLIERFESRKVDGKEKSRLYDSLKLHVRWQFSFSASRTGMKLPHRKAFFHRTALIQRRDISLQTELESPPIPIQKLSRAVGEKVLDLARETSAARYRELHGFTYGDTRSVLRADLGRGTEAFVIGVPSEDRLPLRAYHAAIIFKNGVAVAYFEGLSLFERMESGFNLYYTFRDGETAWLFARILRLMRQLLGVTVISIDPYQIGHENEEGIESGAFWFYRKLGFRPVRPELMKLTSAEEKKIAANPRYRTSARTLRRLAAGHMLLELPTPHASTRAGKWDRFEVRNIGLAVQRRMARDFAGDAAKFRAASIKFVTRVLAEHYDLSKYSQMMENLAPVLALVSDLERWKPNQKLALIRIIQAKATQSESRYLRLMQKHERLRAEMIRLGTK